MHRNTVFSQILQLICRYRFKKCVDRYRGDNYTKLFSCWQQLLVLLFAQARGLTSLRDIEVSLRSHHREWYHLGLTSVARSTLADANTGSDADILKDVFYELLTKCRHSLHELTRIVGELFLDTVYLIEILTIPFNRFKLITQKQGQLTLF